MKAVEIETRIEGGKFKQNNLFIKKAIQIFEGKEIKIIFKRKFKQRSKLQNAFYWGVWIPIFQQLFLSEWQEIKTPSEVHEILKASCNFEEKINENTGEIFKFPKSTTELSTTEWLNYEKRVSELAMDFFKTVLPEPNSQTKLEF